LQRSSRMPAPMIFHLGGHVVPAGAALAPPAPDRHGERRVPAKRTTRGRPPTDARRPQRQGWGVTWQVQEAPEASGLRAPREGRCVLVTHRLAVHHRSDAARLRAYTGQPGAELRGKGAKTPAAIAPIGLEPPTRMAVLGGLSVIALLV
jgi:hypothetical protein